MRISLIITADDSAGYADGLPALVKLLDQYQIKATFLFSLGYDNTGLRLKKLFKPHELARQLPLIQKLRGTLLPPLMLSRKFRQVISQVQSAGHALGIRSFNSVNWEFQAIDADQAWTRQQLEWSVESFHDLFGEKPVIHSASGQIINRHLLSLESLFDFEIALDTRGKTAFYPEYQGAIGNVPNLPFTLPSIEELIAGNLDEVTEDNVHEYLLVESQKQLPQGHVYEVRSAYEGRRWLGILEKMLVMWRSLNWEFCTVPEILQSLKGLDLPTHHVGWASYPPGNQYFATQGLQLMEEKRDA